jgi:signal transduction histidine kinase
MREVTQLVEHAFFMNRIKIIHAPDETLPPLNGDKERLKQVWLNLLNNAADAIGQDGVIYVQSWRGALGRGLEVSVADNGQGVEKEHLSKIFDPFFTTKQVGKGTGLGLSVSFGIIREHGGTISALSPPSAEYLPADFSRSAHFGPGTVFIVALPTGSDGAVETESTGREQGGPVVRP